jgi:hypothetical protein
MLREGFLTKNLTPKVVWCRVLSDSESVVLSVQVPAIVYGIECLSMVCLVICGV